MPSGEKTSVLTNDPGSHDEPAAVWVDLDSLTAWDRNPRKNDEAAKKVAKSISRFGFAAPIVARKANGEIIAGHTRAKAARILGLTKVPVRFVDLDPAEAHLLALADNKLGEIAEWDSGLLGEELSKFGLNDAELAGWSSAELDKIASALCGEPVSDNSAEWDGMPEFENEDKTAFRSIIVHFKSQEDVDSFASTVEQKITEKTKFLWFPEIEIERYADKRYV